MIEKTYYDQVKCFTTDHSHSESYDTAWHKSSKTKYHLQVLETHIKLWDEVNIERLLYEGMTIQQRLRSDKEGMKIAKISIKFKNLMSKENINGALKLLTDNMHYGILRLKKKSLELLVQKNPETREHSSDKSIQ